MRKCEEGESGTTLNCRVAVPLGLPIALAWPRDPPLEWLLLVLVSLLLATAVVAVVAVLLRLGEEEEDCVGVQVLVWAKARAGMGVCQLTVEAYGDAPETPTPEPADVVWRRGLLALP